MIFNLQDLTDRCNGFGLLEPFQQEALKVDALLAIAERLDELARATRPRLMVKKRRWWERCNMDITTRVIVSISTVVGFVLIFRRATDD